MVVFSLLPRPVPNKLSFMRSALAPVAVDRRLWVSPRTRGGIVVRFALGFVLGLMACSFSPAAEASRILVAFEADASTEAIAKLETKFHLTLVQALPEARSRVYSLSVENLAATIRQIENEPAVRYAEVDQKVSIPPTP